MKVSTVIPVCCESGLMCFSYMYYS